MCIGMWEIIKKVDTVNYLIDMAFFGRKGKNRFLGWIQNSPKSNIPEDYKKGQLRTGFANTTPLLICPICGIKFHSQIQEINLIDEYQAICPNCKQGVYDYNGYIVSLN